MKYLLITVFIAILSFISDGCNWIQFENDEFYNETSQSKIVYEREGVKIHKNNNFDIMVFNPKNMDFGVSVGKPKNVNFYMNSNFFDDDPIGLVVVERHRKSSRVKSGGYFYVKDGKPYIGIRSCPTMTDFASQSILWGIKNSSPNNYLIKQRHAKVKTYRNIMGKDKKGNIVVIVSNRAGMVMIKDVIDEGLKWGMVSGVLFDGGTSVDYKYKDDKYSNKFKAVSGKLKRIQGVDEPPVYIYGNLN